MLGSQLSDGGWNQHISRIINEDRTRSNVLSAFRTAEIVVFILIANFDDQLAEEVFLAALSRMASSWFIICILHIVSGEGKSFHTSFDCPALACLPCSACS